MKIFDPNAAAQAYQNSSNIQQAKPAEEKFGNTGGPSFSDFLKNTTERSINTLKGGEAMAAKGIEGSADPTDVVAAVNAADVTLQTVVAVRNRIVSAYNEILRMPI